MNKEAVMNESVKDEITVRIVYEGRAAKVLLDNDKLKEIEAYYQQCEKDGANEYQIEDSKKAISNILEIISPKIINKSFDNILASSMASFTLKVSTVAESAWKKLLKSSMVFERY